jgi:hypothetical protein
VLLSVGFPIITIVSTDTTTIANKNPGEAVPIEQRVRPRTWDMQLWRSLIGEQDAEVEVVGRALNVREKGSSRSAECATLYL